MDNTVDGDTALLVRDKKLIEVAERNIEKFDIVPLYYELKKAIEVKLNPNTLYDGLKSAYTSGNIGLYSNTISKIWNSENIDFDVIKKLCAENNAVIDMAKTLFKPTRPVEFDDRVREYTRKKVPHFFTSAKDKKESGVESILSNTTMGMLENSIEKDRLHFDLKVLGRFDYKMLMKDKKRKINQEVIDLFIEFDKTNNKLIMEAEKSNVVPYIFSSFKEELKQNYDINEAVDSIIYSYFKDRKVKSKRTFWYCFGDIVYENLQYNITELNKSTIVCEVCKKRVEKKSNKTKYCEKCAKKKQLELSRKYKEKVRKK